MFPVLAIIALPDPLNDQTPVTVPAVEIEPAFITVVNKDATLPVVILALAAVRLAVILAFNAVIFAALTLLVSVMLLAAILPVTVIAPNVVVPDSDAEVNASH